MKILTNYDFNKNQILNVVLQKLATAPSSPVAGQMYYNTSDNRAYAYNGTEWVAMDALGASMTGADIVAAINGSASIIDDDNLSQAVNDALTKLAGIDDGANNYSLPIATETILGGVKSGGDVSIDGTGIISVLDDSHSHTIANVDGLQTELDAKETPAGAQSKADAAETAANGYTDQEIAALLDSAPGTLDTLNELAAALGDDPNFATTITNNLALKTDKHSEAIGDGATTAITVTHNLNSRDVVVMIRETASPYAQVIADVEMTTVDTVTVKFATAPATDEYTVTVIG